MIRLTVNVSRGAFGMPIKGPKACRNRIAPEIHRGIESMENRLGDLAEGERTEAGQLFGHVLILFGVPCGGATLGGECRRRTFCAR
jgi:hypothetical protein